MEAAKKEDRPNPKKKDLNWKETGLKVGSFVFTAALSGFCFAAGQHAFGSLFRSLGSKGEVLPFRKVG